MPANGTSAKSLSLSRAGISLALVALGVLALYEVVITTVEVQMTAAAQADAQATANAAAAAVADLPNGPIAVIRKASQIIEARKSNSDAARLGEVEVEIGCWDAAGQSFSTGPGNPNAVRMTIRVRNQPGLFGVLLGDSNHQLEANSIAVLNGSNDSRIAQSRMTSRTVQ